MRLVNPVTVQLAQFSPLNKSSNRKLRGKVEPTMNTYCFSQNTLSRQFYELYCSRTAKVTKPFDPVQKTHKISAQGRHSRFEPYQFLCVEPDSVGPRSLKCCLYFVDCPRNIVRLRMTVSARSHQPTLLLNAICNLARRPLAFIVSI